MAHAFHLRRAGRQARQLAGAAGFLRPPIEDVAPNRQRRQRRNAVDHLDLETVRVLEAHAFPAARLVDRFDRRCALEPRQALELLLALCGIGKADESGLAQMRHMEVMRRVRAAHIERVFGALRAHEAEIGEEFLGEIEIRRLEAAERDIGDFGDRHFQLPPAQSLGCYAPRRRASYRDCHDRYKTSKTSAIAAFPPVFRSLSSAAEAEALTGGTMLRFAYIGTGWWGTELAKNSLLLKDLIEIAGCCALTEQETSTFQRACGGGVFPS